MKTKRTQRREVLSVQCSVVSPGPANSPFAILNSSFGPSPSPRPPAPARPHRAKRTHGRPSRRCPALSCQLTVTGRPLPNSPTDQQSNSLATPRVAGRQTNPPTSQLTSPPELMAASVLRGAARGRSATLRLSLLITHHSAPITLLHACRLQCHASRRTPGERTLDVPNARFAP
jgi:hypothetical protein